MAKIDPTIFKAYDIRGIYPTALNEDLAYKIGRVFARMIKAENPGKKVTIVLSRDMRLSSDSLHQEVLQGFADEEVKIIDLGLTSTPAFYFAVSLFGAEAGMEISASHNPKEYNGFKMTRKNANPINGDNGIYQIRDAVLSAKFARLNRPPIVQNENILGRYIDHAVKSMTPGQKKLTIVIDSANAMAGDDLEAFFKRFPSIKVTFLNRQLDGNFPAHEANPLKEETLSELKKTVVEKAADFGIATDGDGDRYMFIDEMGQYVRPDLVNALLTEKTVTEAKGKPIFYDLRSSKIVEEQIKKFGGVAEKCRVGHAFIKAQMKQGNAYFTGELSGHYYLEVLPDAYFEFPLFVVAKLIEILEEKRESLTKLIQPLRRYFHTNEFNFKINDKEKAIRTFKEKYKDGHQFNLDGLSVEYPTWWFNVRPSNTEPLLRFNLESKSEEEMKQKRQEVTNVIFSLGGEPE